MTLSKKELIALQEEVQEAKTSSSELKGQQTAILNQLKNEFASSTIEEAEDKLSTMDKTIASFDKKIKRGSEELEAELNKENEEEEEE
jgi:ectoine hydroxylase-related dioxygenase (phytanoyl-CoA dioxygenase family)